MNQGSLERLEELLAEVLERPPEERGPFLDDACQDEPELRHQVEGLLAVHNEAAEFFDKLSGDIAAAAALEIESAAQPRLRVGAYQTLAAVGHGGMGAVYRAERVDGAFDQQVALKLLHRDMETPQLRARFVAERQLLARLAHPNIARLLDGGVTEEGRPFFAMEYVEGVPITRHCKENNPSIEKVLRLFLDVIDAVSYLHRNLVVHRDLKPSNILVDRDGQVKLLDFGIAKLLADVPETAEQTRTGEQLMTPEYAAPEQLLGEPVTTATDVYALGVVLYELLTGRRPHERGERRADSRELPPTPSSKLRSRRRRSDAAEDAEPHSEMAVAWRHIAGDLDTICLMALRPEAEARYQSAEQLGQDIERHLGGLPVRARKSTLGYRLSKFAQRHWRGVAATVVLLVLIGFGFLHERGLRRDAQQLAATASAVSQFLQNLLMSVDPRKAQGKEVTVAEMLDQAAGRIKDSPELAGQPTVESAVRFAIGYSYASLGKLVEAREHYERALELRGGINESDPESAIVGAQLGVLYHRLRLFDQAEAVLQQVLELRVNTLGEDDPLSLTAMNHLADLWWTQGQYDKVEQIDRRTLEIRRRLLGDDHPDTLRSFNAVASTLHIRGKYAEAAQLFEQVLEAKRQQLGDSHPETLTLMNNLSAAYLELARYPTAESLLRKLLDARIRVLGEEHHDTATTRHNLGVTLAQQARYEEAAEQLSRAMAVRERVPGQERNYLFSSSYLADVYRSQGRHQEAEALYLSTLRQQRELLGPDHAETLKTTSGLARLRLQQGNPEAAEALVTKILDQQRVTTGEEHPDTLQSLTTLAQVRNVQARFREAQQLAEQAIETGGRGLGEDHPVVLEAVFEKARALAGQQQSQEALELATRVHEARAGLFGEDHPDTVAARELVDSLRRESPR